MTILTASMIAIVGEEYGLMIENVLIAMFISSIVFFLYRFGTMHARRLANKFPNIPGPKPWPFIGDLPSVIQAKGQIHILFDGYYREYGRLFKADFFGLPGLVVSEPEMLKDILVKRFECFHDRPVSNSNYVEAVMSFLTLYYNKYVFCYGLIY